MNTKVFKLLCVMQLLVATTAWSQAQLQEEYRTVLYPSEGEQGYVKIEPGNFMEQEVTFAHKDYPVRRTLRVVGGVQMPGRFAPRGEEYFRQQEYLMDENLDSLNIYKDDYSLFFQGNNEPFERYAYNRITGVDFSKGYVDLEIAYKRKSLKIASAGDFGIELQIYHKKERRHPDDVYDTPDEVVYIPIPAGSGNFKVLKKRVKLSANTATVLIRTGGTDFSGECWLEAPKFYVDDKNVFSHPFIQHEKRQDDYNYWVGVNLATRSRPKWKLEFKGKTIFEGYTFDRASNIADFYIPLPKNIAGKGNLKLTLLKEPHRQAFPYELRSVQLLEESAQDFEIVSIPRYVSVGDTMAILLETNKPNITLKVSADNPNINLIDKSLTLQHPGLHAVQFAALNPDTKVRLNFSDGSLTKSGLIEQFIVKEKDNVHLSSGDEIYIDKEYEPYDQFFKWYFRSRIGNRYHFRPSYQWGGVRITDENIMKHYTSLLNRMHIPYAWQVEGRTLAAAKINPSLPSLQSPMFRGKQAHENDGGYYYWEHFLYNGLFSDIAARTRVYGGIFAKHRLIYTDHGIFIHYDPFGVKDMADGANKFVANLSYSRGESTRHTGVTPIFRYLYQAGYEWLGAEQMYGPEDAIMSALRGTSRVYGKKDFGSLHAMQWGSQPFTDPEHSLRFFLSLAVAYMHGSSHINTEEALWTDEYSNDRYTKAGKEHLYAQHRILDYIETHSRGGELKTEIAVILGRNDAWKTFGRTSIWSQKGDKWAYNKAMESFDLLKVFYPENNLSCYCGTDGLFTTTPYGLVDILPVEASSEVMNSYKALIFLGWNTFDNADFIRIKKFVEQGGTVLLGAVHLNSELQPHIPAKFPEYDLVIQTLLGTDYKSYKSKTVIPLGKGNIIYYPENVYPADDLIKERYVEDMKNIASNITSKEHEKGWIKPSQNIDFSVWDSDKFRTLYLLNVDWKSEHPSQQAKFVLKNHEFNIDVERYAITTLRCHDNIAAMMKGNTSDILSISKENEQWIITCQTTGEDTVCIFNGLTGKQESRKINSPGIHRVEFSK